MKPPFLIVALISSLLLTGCGALIPQNHTEQAAVKTAGSLNETHDDQMTKRSSIPQMKVGGWGNKVEIQPGPQSAPFETVVKSSGSTDSSGSDSAEGKQWTKIPLWVALIGTAVGIAALIAVFKWAKRSSPAVAAAFNAADTEVAALIGKLESQLQTATTDSQKVGILAALADANKARGKIASQAPPPPA